MDWSKVRNGRANAYQLMAPLQQAPLIAGGETLIRRYVRADDYVLDVGAHDRRIERLFVELGAQVHYRSLDVDRTFKHDYYTFDQIHEQFDLITVLDVVEHMPPEVISQMLIDSFKVLKPGAHHPYHAERLPSGTALAGLHAHHADAPRRARRLCPVRRFL